MTAPESVLSDITESPGRIEGTAAVRVDGVWITIGLLDDRVAVLYQGRSLKSSRMTFRTLNAGSLVHLRQATVLRPDMFSPLSG